MATVVLFIGKVTLVMAAAVVLTWLAYRVAEWLDRITGWVD